MGSHALLYLLIFFSMTLVVMLITVFVLSIKQTSIEKEQKGIGRFSDKELRTFGEVEHDWFDEKKVIQQLTSYDGYDEEPKSYQIISDSGKDYYARAFTIEALPKTLLFAETWSAIANFEGAYSAIHIRPKQKKESENQLDRQVTELDAEIMRAEKPENDDRNRARKLREQMRKTEKWANKIENEEDSFFEVGFLIVIYEESLGKLNLKSDSLHQLAKKKNIMLSGCYGVQKEALISTLPLNKIEKSVNTVVSAPIKWHVLNKKALAALYNHKQEMFMHEEGIPLGRGLYDGYPSFWNPYDKSHTNGYSAVFAGDMGVGKSATVKTLESRLMNWNYRFVHIDSQGVLGEGEYTGCVLANGGVVYSFADNADTVVNMMDIEPEISDGKETLQLNRKIDFLELAILTWLEADKADFVATKYMSDILQTALREVYENYGIYDGDVDSLYCENGFTASGEIGFGRVKKEMPILSDVYKQILINSRTTNSKDKEKIYDVVLAGMRRNIRGVYYAEESLKFFTKEEYYNLPEEDVNHKKVRYAVIDGKKEYVAAVEGSSPYFDGKSTVSISDDIPAISFDISSRTKREIKELRSVLMLYIEEYFVKPNNEDADKANKLIVVIDEAKEQWRVGKSARAQCEGLAATCRKKNVGLWWIVQAAKDCDLDRSTETIFKQADVKFLFRQQQMDDEFLKKNLPLSDAQRARLYRLNGSKKQGTNQYTKPGQVCLIDSNNVYFLQVDIMPETEEMVIETDMRKINERGGRGNVFWREE